MSRLDHSPHTKSSRSPWLIGILAAALLAPLTSGCNTMEGAGEDVQAAGGAVSDTAEDVKDEMTD
jgi:predicted small secreted protein